MSNGAMPRASSPLRIFLSYGRDHLADNALVLKKDLEARGHEVWFDLERLREGRDWERYIEQGLNACDRMVLLMTPHSVRRRGPGRPASQDGFCLNEIAKAIELGRLIIPVLLVEVEGGPPVSICRVQYLDLRDAVPFRERSGRYEAGVRRLVRAIEEDDLDFGGSQARLKRFLRPLDFSVEFSRHVARFTGRQWLMDAVDSWLRSRPDARVFWLTGGPGAGKTAFACWLCHWRGDVVASHLCVHGHDDKGDADRALLSMAYQISQALPEYARILDGLELEQEVCKSTRTLFDNLLVGPLSKVSLPAEQGPKLVVIDGIDEATRDGHNAIVEIVAEWNRLPGWLRLVITSRPEAEVVGALAHVSHLRPHVLDTRREENLADLRAFLVQELGRRGLSTPPGVLARLVERSEGLFLYAHVFLDALDQGALSLERPEEYPAGLAEHYRRFFARQFPDRGKYRAEVGPIVETVLAQREPLPLGLLARGVGATDVAALRERMAGLGSLFPIRRRLREGKAAGGAETGASEETVTAFHKSVRDWLTAVDEGTGFFVAGEFRADLSAGESKLAEACAAEVNDGAGQGSPYALRHVAAHLLGCGRTEAAARFLADFGFHYGRLGRLGQEAVRGTIEDLSRALVTQPSAGLREALVEWLGFFRRNAHRFRRDEPGLAPEISLVQAACTGEERGHVGNAAREWMSGTGSGKPWLHRRGGGLSQTGSGLATFEGHRKSVECVVCHPDGRRILSASWDKSLRMWDLDTGGCLATMEGHGGEVTAARIHADGTWAVTGSHDKTLKVWDLRTGECRRTLVGHEDWVKDIALSLDGRRAASAGWDGTVRVWDLATGRALHTLEGHAGPVYGVVFHPDGHRVVSCGYDKTIRIWDLEAGAGPTVLTGHEARVYAVALHPGGHRLVSAGEDGALRLWDLEAGCCIKRIPGSGGWTYALALSRDGRHALSGGEDCAVRLWDLDTAECVAVLRGHTAWIRGVAFHPDGRRAVSAGDDRDVRVWDLPGGRSPAGLAWEGHRGWVRGAAQLGGGTQVVSAGDDRDLRIWDLERGACVRVLAGHTEAVYAVATDPGGRRIVSGSGDKTVKVWDAASGGCLRTLAGHTSWVFSVAVNAGGQTALSGSFDGTVKVWDMGTGECLRTMEGHGHRVRGVAFHPDGRRAISGGDDRTVRVWDTTTGQRLRTLAGHQDVVNEVAVDSAGRRALSASEDKTVRVWDLASGECLRVLEGEGDAVYAVAFHPEGRLAVCGRRDKTLRVWDIETGECVATWVGESSVACCVWGRGPIIAGTQSGELLFLELMSPGPWRPGEREGQA